MALITCKNLNLGYNGNSVICNINFEINKGDYLCVVGENGAGKTTLIKTLLGLQKQISGEITTEKGFSLNNIGYLPQQTVVQKDFPASVSEVVLSGTQNKSHSPFYRKPQKELAKNNIEKMHLNGLEKKCYRELSGGQQQRVLLARALCATKDVILLDEPVAGLDPIVMNDLYNVIYDLNKKDKITVIMISHDIKSVLKYATHVLHLSKTIFFGTKDEYLTSDLGKQFLQGEKDE